MYLKNIKLVNFRNYQNETINFINGINLFIGQNAQGKTNIIESIYLSAMGKSFRTIKDSEVINFGKDYCKIDLDYFNSQDEKIEIYIDKFNKKVIKENDVKIKKISDHFSKLLIVSFFPDSLDIVKKSPQIRRNFLDEICSKLSKKYLLNLQEYMKCLKMKNAMLKNDKEKIDLNYIDILHEKMSIYIENIVKYRAYVVKLILEKAIIIHKVLTKSKEIINIKYISDFINLSKEEIEKQLNDFLKIEILRKTSLKGIQRDDLDFYINNLEVCKYCSQGQCRTTLLTLKLAEFEVLKEQNGKDPILLLDDIMSELDSNRVEFLLNYIKDYQSIITTTDFNMKVNIKNINIKKVLNGKLDI